MATSASTLYAAGPSSGAGNANDAADHFAACETLVGMSSAKLRASEEDVPEAIVVDESPSPSRDSETDRYPVPRKMIARRWFLGDEEGDKEDDGDAMIMTRKRTKERGFVLALASEGARPAPAVTSVSQLRSENARLAGEVDDLRAVNARLRIDLARAEETFKEELRRRDSAENERVAAFRESKNRLSAAQNEYDADRVRLELERATKKRRMEERHREIAEKEERLMELLRQAKRAREEIESRFSKMNAEWEARIARKRALVAVALGDMVAMAHGTIPRSENEEQ